MKKIVFAVFFGVLAGIWGSFASSVDAQTTPPCVALTADLSYGATDQYPGPVTILQNYLFSTSYLAATPNGHFGPATRAAVKAFQKANGISMTGTAGPLTRAAIQKKSCGVTTQSTVPYYGTTSSMTPAMTTPVTTPTPAVTITSPASGATLTIGKTYPISWNVSTNYPYNIILEQPGGSGAGFIASSLSGGSSYSWQVGNVFSSAINANQTVATGTYRVRIVSTSAGMTATDPVSGWFTLVGPPFVVNSVAPTSIPADGRTVGIVYGTGFDASSVLYFDQMYGLRPTVQYVSTDGTVIAFSVPVGTPVGGHTLFVANQYGTVSNSVYIYVTPAAQ